METKTLLTFRTAAQSLSFTRTASTLGYAQSSVTAQMKALEETLGYALFNRVGNHLQLTKPGRRFLVYADRILALTDEAMSSNMETEDVGVVRFTATETIGTYLLPPVLKAFTRAFPKIRLQFLPGFSRDFKRQVLEGAVDFAFILEASFPSKTLAVEKLRDEEILILGCAGHRLASSPSVSSRDLVREPALLKTNGCSYRDQFERQLIAAGARPGNGMEFQHVETIKRCVEVGLGIAPLPRMAVEDELESGRLVPLPWDGPSLQVSTYLVWNPQRHLDAAGHAFLEHVRGMMHSAGEPAGEGAPSPAATFRTQPRT